jgi:hypothetical protein
MTEAEWLACRDPHALFEQYPKPLSIRKVRLYSIACLRNPKNWPGRPEWHEALAVVERYADQQTADDELIEARSRVEPTLLAGTHSNPWDVLPLALVPRAIGGLFARCIAATAVEFWQRDAFPSELLREIFGNPFCPVAFDKRWRTDTAIAVAKTMYETREFGAAPILADALQDAGCDSDDLLNHLRDTATAHVRGCWALDLVLGKE